VLAKAQCVYKYFESGGVANMFDLLRRIVSGLRQRKIESYLGYLKNKGLAIGENTNILEPFFFDPQHCFLISIGDNCTLAPNVRLIAHDASSKQHLGFTRIGKITIHNNCFIGDSVIVLPNVSIGPNTIIGAGTVVNKDVPGNVVAAGNPVKVLCSLQDYTDKISRSAKAKGVYGDEFLLENITQDRMKEMLNELQNGEAFIK